MKEKIGKKISENSFCFSIITLFLSYIPFYDIHNKMNDFSENKVGSDIKNSITFF